MIANSPDPNWTDVWGLYATVVGVVVAAGAGVATIIVAVQAKRAADRSVEIAQTAVEMQEHAAQADYKAGLDKALRGVILAMSRRVDQIGDDPNGDLPLDNDLQAAVEVAWMTARGDDLEPLEAIGKLTYSLKLGYWRWVRSHLGEFAADIRRWRTGEMERQAFIDKFTQQTEALKARNPRE